MHRKNCLFNECGEGDCMHATKNSISKQLMSIDEIIKNLDKKIEGIQEWLIRHYR